MAAHGAKAKCLGEGSVKLGMELLKTCVYVKGRNTTLLLVEQICDNGIIVIIIKKDAVTINQQTIDVNQTCIVATVKQCNNSGLYRTPRLKSELFYNSSTTINRANLWHRRLVHARKSVLDLVPQMTAVIKSISDSLTPCHPCRLGKANKNFSNLILKVRSSLVKLFTLTLFHHFQLVSKAIATSVRFWISFHDTNT